MERGTPGATRYTSTQPSQGIADHNRFPEVPIACDCLGVGWIGYQDLRITAATDFGAELIELDPGPAEAFYPDPTWFLGRAQALAAFSVNPSSCDDTQDARYAVMLLRAVLARRDRFSLRRMGQDPSQAARYCTFALVRSSPCRRHLMLTYHLPVPRLVRLQGRR